MKAADGVQIAERYIMDFPEAFEFIKQTAPDKETHHPKCSYRQAGMLCDCSIIWAEYHKRRANGAEERERVLREALETLAAPLDDKKRPYEGWFPVRALAKKWGIYEEDVQDAIDLIPIVARAALTAAPEQPDRSVCPDCKSTTRSFRGRRGDEHGEWVCDNEWHAPAQGKEAKS